MGAQFMTKPNPLNNLEQTQKLQEIGANLYHIRTEQGISLDEIAQKTAIAKRVLEAIEQGDVNDLPEPFYTKALIKKYAQALGVSNIPDYTAVTESTPEPVIQSPQWLDNFRLSSIHLYLLYLFIVGISVRLITFNLTDNQVISNQETLVQSEPQNNNTELIENKSSSSQLISRSNHTPLEEVTVGVDLKERCWMKVIVDGKVIYEGTLPAGTSRTWTGKKQVTIVAGNAGGVAVTYNHGAEKLLGEPGQVQEVTYTVN